MTTVTMLTRLATTLTTAVDQLRSMCAGAVVPDEEEPQSTVELQSYNSNTVSLREEYNGNTLHTIPDTAPKQEPPEVNQSSEVCPPFDPSQVRAGQALSAAAWVGLNRANTPHY